MAVSRHELAGPLAGAAAAKRRDSGNTVMSPLAVESRAPRLVFDAGQPYEKFRGRYEAAVPPADPRPGDRAGRHRRRPEDGAGADGSRPRGQIRGRGPAQAGAYGGRMSPRTPMDPARTALSCTGART